MDEKDFEVVIDFFLKDTDMVVEEDRSDRGGIFWKNLTEVKRLLVVQIF